MVRRGVAIGYVVLALAGAAIVAASVLIMAKPTHAHPDKKVAASPLYDPSTQTPYMRSYVFINAGNANSPGDVCDFLDRKYIYPRYGFKSYSDCMVYFQDRVRSLATLKPPRVLFVTQTSKTTARVRVLIDGTHLFLYLTKEKDGRWYLVGMECLTCGTPGAGVPSSLAN